VELGATSRELPAIGNKTDSSEIESLADFEGAERNMTLTMSVHSSRTLGADNVSLVCVMFTERNLTCRREIPVCSRI
jgi:hypothetical protein